MGAQSSSTDYKNKVSYLKGKTNLKYESGFEEKKNGSYNQLQNRDDNSLKADPTNDTKGYVHNHVDDYETGTFDANGDPIVNKPVRMFSPGDVNILRNMADQNRSSGNFSGYYVSMVTNFGHYMIKFTGTTNDINTGFGGKDWAIKYRDFMENSNNLEKSFLQFMKNKMGITGVELFQIKNDGTVKTISLKPDGKTIKKKDC
jgi:hypothetical protein